MNHKHSLHNPLVHPAIVAARPAFFERLIAECRRARVETDDPILTWGQAIPAFTLQSAIDGHEGEQIASAINQFHSSKFFATQPDTSAFSITSLEEAGCGRND